MFHRHIPLLMVLLLTPTLLFANNLIRPMNTLPPVLTGLEDVPDDIPVVPPPYNLVEVDGIDIIGDTMMVGDTWYEYQHNGQIGRQIVLDDNGYVHMVWTDGLDEQSSSRHIYYNFIDPDGNQGWPYTGYAVESSQRAGFTSLAVNSQGIAFPAFHQITGASLNPHTAVACDFFPHTGAFLTYEIPWYGGEDLPYIWPRITMNQSEQMLITSVGNDPASGQTWSMGTYDPLTYSIGYTPQVLTPAISYISNEVGGSKISDRIGGAWAAPLEGVENGGADLWAMVDDDGQDLNFDNYWNVTNFIPPDLSWLPDTLLANGDTLRVYTDCSMFFDMDGYLNIAFTTVRWFTLEGGYVYWNASLIWHWSERWPNDYRLIANAFDPENIIDCGAWNFRAQRPSLGQDPETGYLYCMYQEFDVDSSALSQSGWPSGEIKISVSTDNGLTWSVGTNVTNTVTPSGAPPGSCLSEAWPSMAEKVDGYCHLLYVLDLDAGANLQGEGSITLNPIIYQKVPVDEIPTTPTVENLPFHVTHTPPPPAVNPNPDLQPSEFALEQNAPNPFNPTTVIRFSLDEAAEIDLSVYNMRGERVAVVAQGSYTPGTYNVAFDGSRLASGVYFYRLNAGGRILQKKMLLIK